MQQELIELLEKVVDHVVFCNGHDQRFTSTRYGVKILEEAGELVKKAKNSAKEPAVPQGEPVAWMVTNGGPHSLYFSRMYADDAVWMAKNVCYKKSIPNDFQIHPLYSTPAPAPAQKVGLTDDEIFHLWDVHVAYTPDKPCKYPLTKGDILNFSRAIIAALHANGK